MPNNRYEVVSGHDRCHPETCCCWNYRIKDHQTNTYVDHMNTDSKREAESNCANLNAGLVRAWVDPSTLK